MPGEIVLPVADRSFAILDRPALSDNGDRNPVTLHRHIVAMFAGQEADDGVQFGRRDIVPPAKVVLEFIVRKCSRPDMV